MMIRKFFKALFAPFTSPLNSFEASMTFDPVSERARKPTGPRSEAMKMIALLNIGGSVEFPNTTKARGTQLIKRAVHHNPDRAFRLVALNNTNTLAIERTA